MRRRPPIRSFAHRWHLSSTCFALSAFVLLAGTIQSQAQAVDCARLQQQLVLANNGGSDQFVAAARKQTVELQRTTAYAHQLGCDRQGGFFAAAPPQQCGALNARIAQMQGNLAQLQTASRGNSGHAELVARYNAYCHGGAQTAAVQPQQPPHQRGFFESLFGGGQEESRPPPAVVPTDSALEGGAGEEDGIGAHGGSQAVCVRSCDGGFFPLPLSSHHPGDSLTEMCEALCPGTEASVYTRNPDSEIKTAVSIHGTPYMDMPNALKFQKSFDPACTCRPPGKTWAEALANAETVLGNQRKGDIMVTPEKSAEMARPKLDPKAKTSIQNEPLPAAVPAGGAKAPVSPPASNDAAPNAPTRPVRQVGPQP
ncbi:MAG: DUF2865 domain-containing protein [Beijerinckiaceae bacterium]